MSPAFRLLVAFACAALACRSHPAPPPATARSPAAPPSSSSPVPRTAEECKACRGEWGRHGLAEAESCNCHTNDGGKRCRDGTECQGMCIAANEEPEREE